MTVAGPHRLEPGDVVEDLAALEPGTVVRDADGDTFRRVETTGRKRWENCDDFGLGLSKDLHLKPPIVYVGRLCPAAYGQMRCDLAYGHGPAAVHHWHGVGKWRDDCDGVGRWCDDD